MGLFTIKRRQSVNQDPSSPKPIQKTPTPIFAQHQQINCNNNGLYLDAKSPYSMEMPDLRFSKLNLEIDMNNFKGGPDSRPVSIVQGEEERRRSKMALLNYNDSKASLTEDSQMSKLAMQQGKNSSVNHLYDGGSIRSRNSSQRGMDQDTRKLVASATEAMNLDVPVKAPSRQQAGPSPLGGMKPSPKKTKKEIKKEEKERLAMEKANMEMERATREKNRAKLERDRASKAIMEQDRARQIARKLATADDKGRQTHQATNRASNMDPPPRKRSTPDLRHTQRSLTSTTSDSNSLVRMPLPEKSRDRTRSKSPASASATSHRRPPNAPPSHKPPLIPSKHTPNMSQSSQGAGVEANSASFQFPKQQSNGFGGPIAHRTQSAIPATDGIARPIVVRGQTVAPEKKTNKQSINSGGIFGMPMTSSPPMQPRGTFASSQPGKSSYRSPRRMVRGSSSDDGGTSTSAEGPSLDSNTSIDDNSADDTNDHFVDARNTLSSRARPERDEGREERAQRLSGNFDMEVIKALQGNEDHYHSRTDSATDKFSALLAASRPGGAGDRSAEATETNASKTRMEAQRQRYLNNKQTAFRAPPPPPQPIKRIREVAPTPKRRNIVRPELIDQGVGWTCLGVRDLHVPNVRERIVAETILVPRVKEMERIERDENGNEIKKEQVIEMIEQKINVSYNDLFELIWTSTTPDVISRLFSHLDISDLKALRQVSHSIRFTLDVHDNREMILNQYLTCIGYRTWTPAKGAASARTGGRLIPSNMSKDPCPISFNDCEAFLISHDLLPEYAAVGKEFAANPSAMDPRMARLAQASTRAHSRVLTRLRLQPVFKIPKTNTSSHEARVENSSSGLSDASNLLDVHKSTLPRHNSYYPSKSVSSSPELSLRLHTKSSPSPIDSMITFSPIVSSPLSSALSPSTTNVESFTNIATQIKSPWKSGRAAFYQVWVPASDPNGWLSDEELTECESQLYKAGIWNFLKKGDVVWDTAVGDQLNEGKYIFDGRYLRDLSYAHDPVGHLPSWLNCVLYSPSYWHNVIHCSSPRPIIFFDISPWKDQILNSLRLVQDHVEGYSNSGNRYRIAKWLYRSAANIACGQIISKMSASLEIVDEGWNGRIVIETEGTAEHAKALISRCAGPNASPQAKAALLASVMGDAKAANRAMNTNDTRGLTQSSFMSGSQPQSYEVQNSPWMIMRERSRPGLIWIKLAGV